MSDTLTFFAQPYDISACGFYFASLDEYNSKYKSNVNSYGQPIEEYEIQYINGSKAETELFAITSLEQMHIPQYFKLADQITNDHDIVAFSIAVNDLHKKIDADTNLDDFNDEISIHYADTYKDLAEQFIDEGMLGDIPQHLQNYIDADAYANDLKCDYFQADVMGETVFYMTF